MDTIVSPLDWDGDEEYEPPDERRYYELFGDENEEDVFDDDDNCIELMIPDWEEVERELDAECKEKA